jgi:hypothetical protein
MRYDLMFQDIVKTIRDDYAGRQEIKNMNVSKAFASTLGNAYSKGTLDKLFFLRIIQQYFAVLQDRNLQFTLADSEEYQASSRGFYARRKGDFLYVTEVTQDDRLRPGDKITRINSKAPGFFRQHLMQNIFGSEEPERELWNGFLKMANKIRVEHADGSTEDLELKSFPPEPLLSGVSFRQMDERTVYLKIESFYNEEAIENLTAENREVLENCEKLIVDVRRNRGGYDHAYLPLLPFICDRTMKWKDFMGEQGVYTNYTKKNCDRRIGQLTLYLGSGDADAEEMARELIRETKDQYGVGYVYEKDRDLALSEEKITVGKAPRQVILLTDTWCEDAGERFVQQCRRMEKVKVIGRPTMGTIDYSNNITIDYGEGFLFTYPISRSRDCQKGRGVRRRGVRVDEYLAWTPAECTEDLILKRAMEL